MNSLCAASNALSAAASSRVSWGGGGGGVGFFKTAGTLAVINFRCGVVRWLRAALRTGCFACFGFGEALRAAFFATTFTGFDRPLVVFALLALFARALPAGERLVAGFSRVAFATVRLTFADFAPERRATERDEDFFNDLATELLIGKTIQRPLLQATQSAKMTREGSIACPLNQRKSRVCGSCDAECSTSSVYD